MEGCFGFSKMPVHRTIQTLKSNGYLAWRLALALQLAGSRPFKSLVTSSVLPNVSPRLGKDKLGGF